MTTYDCPVCGAYREPCDKKIHADAEEARKIWWAGANTIDCQTCSRQGGACPKREVKEYCVFYKMRHDESER